MAVGRHYINHTSISAVNPLALADEIIAGKRLSRNDNLSEFLQMDLSALRRGANRIRKALCGNVFEFCGIINAISGKCGEDCRFCAQSCCYHTSAEEYDILSLEEIAHDAKKYETSGVGRYSIVTAGRGLHGKDFLQALCIYRKLHGSTSLSLCASHGLQTEEEFRKLKAAGVTRYHANLETSARYFPQICSTHTYQDKIENILRARRAGLSVCSGGIIGMGETPEDRLNMAISLAELHITSIPINLFTPIEGTPLAKTPPISQEDALRTVAFFRYLNPTAQIRMAAGRRRFADSGAAFFCSGANAAITGNMLTTAGTSAAEDCLMVKRLGFTLS